MAPPRRVRDESLVLRKEGVPDREIAKGNETYWSYAMPSQRRFQASPDARVLAYVSPGSGELHVLRRDGAELVTDGARDQELRCSPDGSMLAIARDVGGGRRIDKIDLRRMVQSPWADLPHVVYWMELCADGLVVSHWSRPGTDALTLVPWQGQLQTLVETPQAVRRFSAASAGSKVVYTLGSDAWSMDAPGAVATKLAADRYEVTNMEMSPDGRSVAMVSHKGIELYTNGAEPRLLDGSRDIHTVWFSRDGAELAWASPDAAFWRRGETVRTLAPRDEDEPIKAMRFLRGGAGLLVSRGNEVIRWSPEHEETEVLARIDDGRELLGADVFDGGLVLWLGTPLTYLHRGRGA